jgi:protein Mpv17
MMPALLANWKLWPAAQLINFTLIPEEQRILYNNIIGICWTCVISNMQQNSAAEGAADSSAGSVANAQQVASAPSASPRGTQESVGCGIPSLTLRRRSSSLAA